MGRSSNSPPQNCSDDRSGPRLKVVNGTHVLSPGTNGLSRWLTLGDFKGDGKLDLAVANGNHDNVVRVLLGNGDASFQNQLQYATGGFMIDSRPGGLGLKFSPLLLVALIKLGAENGVDRSGNRD